MGDEGRQTDLIERARRGTFGERDKLDDLARALGDASPLPHSELARRMAVMAQDTGPRLRPDIRLRPGEPRQPLDRHALMLGYTSDGEVGPDKEIEIVRRSQLPAVPVGLVLDGATADAFELTDMRVGKCSQFLQADPIPLSPFARREDFPEMVDVDLTDEELNGQLFELDVVQISQDFKLRVRNTATVPVLFRGFVIMRPVRGSFC